MAEATAKTLLERRFPAQPGELSSVRAAVRQAVESGGGSSECAADVVMAVDEACQNIIRHAYAGDPDGSIVLRIERRGHELVISLIDFAPGVDPEQVKGRDLDELRPGGLGTHLIRQAMDEVDFVDPPPECGNLLRMVKRLE
jgi:sigma-B regulation protein RsbU (phosphoserine phosphatase)